MARSAGTSALGTETAAAATPRGAPRYNVTGVRIGVPESLSVSEANSFYPVADIVWRGDPPGDRHAQVQRIFGEAFGAATAGMRGGAGRPDVIVEATVRRFHALTEKTRYTFGGTYGLRFDLTVRDARSGAVLEGPRYVIADAPGAGGERAVAEERAGRTQRVAIIEALTASIRRELSGPAAPAQVPAARADTDPGRIEHADTIRWVQMSL